jgi:gamma-glutamylcyclotransferase (GGCT)/AIG2-like uncharacterized protein YtfP
MRPLLARLRRRGPATASGALYDLGDLPGLSLDADGTVRGELVLVNSASAWLRLDTYEGYDRAHPERSLFRRVQCIATRLEEDGQPGEQVECWVYVYNRDVADAARIESGCWLTHKCDGDIIEVAV